MERVLKASATKVSDKSIGAGIVNVAAMLPDSSKDAKLSTTEFKKSATKDGEYTRVKDGDTLEATDFILFDVPEGAASPYFFSYTVNGKNITITGYNGNDSGNGRKSYTAQYNDLKGSHSSYSKSIWSRFCRPRKIGYIFSLYGTCRQHSAGRKMDSWRRNSFRYFHKRKDRKSYDKEDRSCGYQVFRCSNS